MSTGRLASRRGALLAVSLAANTMMLTFGAVWIARKGGPRYVLGQLGLVRGIAPVQEFQVDAASEFRQWPNAADEIVFAGDSITRSMPWEEVLTEVRNRGIGGETSGGLLDRFGEIVESKPLQVFINIGTNDLLHGFATDDIVKNVRAIMDMTARDSPRTEVLLISVLPINLKFKRDALYLAKHEALPGLNAALRALADEKGVTFIDLWPTFADEDGQLRSELTRDGTHLSVAGKLRYADCIRPYVKPRGKQ